LKGKAGNDPKRYKHFDNAKETMQEFMKVLSIANECVIENGDYQGPSPDEIELVKFSKKVGFELVNDKPPSIKVKEQYLQPSDPSGILIKDTIVDREYEVFKIIGFNSDRKRMSIIVRDPDDGLIKLYCKGADSIIIDRLDPN
jgi:magnesium-transporting ATPase (P-type)